MSADNKSYFPPDIPVGALSLGEARPHTAKIIRNPFLQPDIPLGTPSLKDIGESRKGEGGKQFSFHTPDLSPMKAEAQITPIAENGQIGFGQLPAREPALLYPQKANIV